jgi:hypothetical protein
VKIWVGRFDDISFEALLSVLYDGIIQNGSDL